MWSILKYLKKREEKNIKTSTRNGFNWAMHEYFMESVPLEYIEDQSSYSGYSSYRGFSTGASKAISIISKIEGDQELIEVLTNRVKELSGTTPRIIPKPPKPPRKRIIKDIL